MELGKIVGAIVLAGVIAVGSGFISRQIVHAERLDKNVFNIEVTQVAADAPAAPAAEAAPAADAAAAPAAASVLAMIATADVAKGEKLAKACAACHNFVKGGPKGVGPNLYDVVGGPKNHMAGFAYSGKLQSKGGNTWTYNELNQFLTKPAAYAPGTKMTFAGLKKPEDRAAVIAWLRTLSDAPKPLPTAAEIAAETK